MPSSMLLREVGVPVAGMMSNWIAWPDCSRSVAAGIDRRVHPLVEMDEVARIEDDAEERIAEVALDERVDLAAGDADADRLVPFGGAGEVGRGQPLDVVADVVRQARLRLRPAKPARHVSAPQVPKAMVNGSPRSMTRSDGLRRPKRRVGPAESMRWQLSGSPIGRIRLAASNSRMPARRPNSTRLIASEACDAANSNCASWSISLIARRPVLAAMRISVALTTAAGRPDDGPDRVDDERRDLDPGLRRRRLVAAEILPARRCRPLRRRRSRPRAAGRRAAACGCGPGRAGRRAGRASPRGRSAERRAALVFRAGQHHRHRARRRPPSAPPRSAGRSRSGRRGWRNARGRHRRRGLDRPASRRASEAVDAARRRSRRRVPAGSSARRTPAASRRQA